MNHLSSTIPRRKKLFRGELIFCAFVKETGAHCSTVLKKTGALLFAGEGNLIVLYCFEENWCTTALRRKKPVIYCFEENWYTIVPRRIKLVF